MKIRLAAIGQKMPGWVQAGVEEYQRRLPPQLQLEIHELPLGQRSRNADLARALNRERDALLKVPGPGDRILALDVKGQRWSTEGLARQAQSWMDEGGDVTLFIGGPDGLHPDCLERAQQRWSLGPLTLPHPLVRVIIAEQLYRAWTILSGHPYHRGSEK